MAQRLSPLARDIELIISEELSPEAQVQRYAEFAQGVLKEGQETNRQALGYTPDHDLFVGGSAASTLSGLKITDAITYEFHLLFDVIAWIDEQLILHSPVKTERYARSHAWFADDVPFPDPHNPPPAQAYTVLNSQPYSRKVERGQSSQAPDGVYESVAVMAKRRFGNVAFVGFSYRSFPGGAVGEWAQTASAAKLARDVRGGRRSLHADWLTRQPAIYIDPGR